jgi:hypothetical protein
MNVLEQQAMHSQIRMNGEVVNHLTSINWEQRRYEIAKDVYCTLLEQRDGLTHHQKAENAVLRADALIEALKKKD